MYYYSLRIDAFTDDKIIAINNILEVKSNFSPTAGWGLEVKEGESDAEFFFIDYFLSLLRGKYEKLEKIGVTRDSISIWMLYEYEGQCNMEFLPEDMYNLGKEGIVLCVSCWEK
ncbi:MAG: hypothetical protein FWF54_10310 [Candidatus Azobacteroides sp.]|nr:hypothetical protein [Candidatus Azobacteroides sp.]